MEGYHRFSNFEICILLGMFCVIGLIDIPQMIKAGDEAKLSELIQSLERVRTRLDVYRSEHDWALPPSDSFTSFEQALTKNDKDESSYIEQIPKNPFNDLSLVRFDGPPAGAGKAGWRFDTKTGDFQADHDPSYAEL